MIKLDGEEIDGIAICNVINYLLENSIYYNFNIEDKWIEFYVTVKKPLTINQMSIALYHLNAQMSYLQSKGWSHCFKNKETRWYDEFWKPLHSYAIMTLKTTNEEPTYPILNQLTKK